MSLFHDQMLAKFHHVGPYDPNFTLSFFLQELSSAGRGNSTNTHLIYEVLQWLSSLGFYPLGIHAGAIELDCFLFS